MNVSTLAVSKRVQCFMLTLHRVGYDNLCLQFVELEYPDQLLLDMPAVLSVQQSKLYKTITSTCMYL